MFCFNLCLVTHTLVSFISKYKKQVNLILLSFVIIIIHTPFSYTKMLLCKIVVCVTTSNTMGKQTNKQTNNVAAKNSKVLNFVFKLICS